MQYAEFLKNRCNEVDETFYDTIRFTVSMYHGNDVFSIILEIA